jgi:hypothetical protein
MPRRMSFSKTLEQMRARTKTVTRREGWWDEEAAMPRVHPGDRITAIEKGMGLKPGERQVVMHDIQVVSVRRERLDAITAEDLVLEGFPGWTKADFMGLFPVPPDTMVTRIEFKHLGGE